MTAQSGTTRGPVPTPADVAAMAQRSRQAAQASAASSQAAAAGEGHSGASASESSSDSEGEPGPRVPHLTREPGQARHDEPRTGPIHTIVDPADSSTLSSQPTTYRRESWTGR